MAAEKRLKNPEIVETPEEQLKKINENTLKSQILKLPVTLEEKKITLKRLTFLLHGYSAYRNSVNEFDTLVKKIEHKSATVLTDAEVHFLMLVELAYVKIYKPTNALDFVEELKSHFKSAKVKLEKLEKMDLVADPKLFKTYIELLRVVRDYLKLSADYQAVIYNTRTFDEIISLIMDEASLDLKQKVMQILNTQASR